MTMPDPSSQRLRLIAAPFTAFAPDGSIDLGQVKHQARHLREAGVVGAFVAGTTGESASLTTRERIALTEEWRTHAGALELIVHIGSARVDEARELAAHAQSIGADAIGAVPPYYFRAGSVDALVTVMAGIASAAPSLPFFYYHIPALTKVELPMMPFLAAARERIPNFAGIKFTHSDIGEYADLVDAAGDDLQIMFGRDPLLLPALSVGAVTAVGSTYNFAAPLYLEMAAALFGGDLVTALASQRVAQQLVDIANRHGGLAAQKAIYGMIGVECGPARAPFEPLDDSALAALRAFVEARGLITARA
jgi:N-acetylneuraminate lyase